MTSRTSRWKQPRRRPWGRFLVLAALTLVLAPGAWVGVGRAGLRIRMSQCVVAARDGKRQCLDDLGKARIPRNRYMMEGLVRNCSLESQYAVELCTVPAHD